MRTPIALPAAKVVARSFPMLRTAQGEFTLFAAPSLTRALQDVATARGKRATMVISHSFASLRAVLDYYRHPTPTCFAGSAVFHNHGSATQ